MKDRYLSNPYKARQSRIAPKPTGNYTQYPINTKFVQRLEPAECEGATESQKIWEGKKY